MITDKQDLQEMLSRIEQGKHVHIDWKMKLQYMMKKQFVATERCELSLGTIIQFLRNSIVLTKSAVCLKDVPVSFPTNFIIAFN